MVNKWMNISQIRLAPNTCILCGASGRYNMDLCPACEADLPRTETSCYRCAADITAPGEPLCGHCLKHPPPMQQTISALCYGPPLERLITDLKFHQKLVVARILGQLLGNHLGKLGIDRPEALIPVPLHPRRLRERGYNQALEIARYVARRFQLPLDIDLCRRQRHTPPQSGLSAKQRHKNMRHAFALSRPCPYTHVAIIDDVITTGYTVRAMSALLRRHGAERVQVWSVARAMTD